MWEDEHQDGCWDEGSQDELGQEAAVPLLQTFHPGQSCRRQSGRPFVTDGDRAEPEQVIEELQAQAGLDAAGNGMRAHLAGKGHQRPQAEDTQQQPQPVAFIGKIPASQIHFRDDRSGQCSLGDHHPGSQQVGGQG